MAVQMAENPSKANTPNFDPLARAYRWMEYLSFGPILERCRFHFLPACRTAHRALVLGDGDGRFTARLLATNRSIQIDAVDASAAMLRELHVRAAHSVDDADHRLRTVQADLRRYTPDRSGYDLVVSHFFLDCLTEDEMEEMGAGIVPHLASRCRWLISEFAIPERRWSRAVARALIRFLYLAFQTMTHLHVKKIPDYARILVACGFGRQQQVHFLGGLLTAEIWERDDSR